MISKKYQSFQFPLTIDLDINNILIPDINYKESQIDDHIVRSVNYVIDKEENVFNKIINDCEDSKIFDIDKKSSYNELILEKKPYEEGEDENIETLIKNMQDKNDKIQNQIMKLRNFIFVTKSVLPGDKPEYNLIPHDEEFLEKINKLLEQFVVNENKKLNL
jgi:hypothetical protein